MNVLKNMEIIFVVAAALGAAGSYVTTRTPASAVAPAAVIAQADGAMAVVTVKAKRLSAAEKAALI